MNSLVRIIAIALAAAGLAACKKDPPPAPPPTTSAPAPAQIPAPAAVSVATATLGSAVGPDKKVTRSADSFAKGDTIYVALETTGSGTATVKARWTYNSSGKWVPVKEDSQTIQATGPAVTEFHVSKPDGWPVGEYQVEVLLNDQVAQTRKFTVR